MKHAAMPPAAEKQVAAALVTLWVFCVTTLQLAAAADRAADDIPPLHPPRPEVPSGLWEQYGLWLIVGPLLLLLLIAAAVYFLARPKPTPPVPPHEQALSDLNALNGAPEEGLLLSRVSQVLRQYVGRVLQLPEIERTTAELAEALTHGTALSGSTKDHLLLFLRNCDQRKFAPWPAPQPAGVVSAAVALVQEVEASRAPAPEADAGA